MFVRTSWEKTAKQKKGISEEALWEREKHQEDSEFMVTLHYFHFKYTLNLLLCIYHEEMLLLRITTTSLRQIGQNDKTLK